MIYVEFVTLDLNTHWGYGLFYCTYVHSNFVKFSLKRCFMTLNSNRWQYCANIWLWNSLVYLKVLHVKNNILRLFMHALYTWTTFILPIETKTLYSMVIFFYFKFEMAILYKIHWTTKKSIKICINPHI
jgi:hypothetical protein